jgi:hemerythrin-like domain-containing protein
MSLQKDTVYPNIEENIIQSWRDFVLNMEKSIAMLENEIDEAAQMASTCTSEWCEATEHVIDELSNSLFSISEPRWSSKEDSDKIKQLKRKIHDLYAKYKSTAKK